MNGSDPIASRGTARLTRLPDPRDANAPDGATCDVFLPARTWKHLIGKHVTDPREPWSEWLGNALCERLIQRGDGSESVDDDSLESAGRVLAESLRASCSRPLVLLYESRTSQHSAVRHRWLAVLPNGAAAVIEASRPRLDLVTCFFSMAACRARQPRDRWRKQVALLVRRYCAWSPEGLEPPPAERVVAVAQQDGPPIFRSRLRFVSLANWGFGTEMKRPVWRGRFSPWPAADDLSPARKPSRRFALNRRLEREEGLDHEP